jgi:hypothetical protein
MTENYRISAEVLHAALERFIGGVEKFGREHAEELAQLSGMPHLVREVQGHVEDTRTLSDPAVALARFKEAIVKVNDTWGVGADSYRIIEKLKRIDAELAEVTRGWTLADYYDVCQQALISYGLEKA